MGSLILPASGPVYADAQIFIYSVEKHPIYAPTLRPLWEAVARGDLEVQQRVDSDGDAHWTAETGGCGACSRGGL